MFEYWWSRSYPSCGRVLKRKTEYGIAWKCKCGWTTADQSRGIREPDHHQAVEE